MLVLRGEGLRVEDVVAVARRGEKVRLAPSARARMVRSHRAVERMGRAGHVAYGIKTGFGELASVTIADADVRALQVNLVRSHAAGVGDPLPEEAVRAMMLARANGLAKGYSGVRPTVVEALLALLNRGVCPVVPEKGSLGASGDLAPLAHMALVLIGEGEAVVGGRRMGGAAALRRARLRPLRLESKEGLALINATSAMAGLGALAVHDAERLLDHAQRAAAMSLEALRGSTEPFDARLARVRPYEGHAVVAANLRRLLRGSRLADSQKHRRVQDAYTLRCIPQVLGAVHDGLGHVRRVVKVELNAATDNPLVFPGDVALSCGNFHGQALAHALDFLALQLCTVANFAERRVARLMDAHLSGLPPFLTKQGGLHSGLMVAQYTAAALASEAKALAVPASADTIPTSANQEDFVSMGMAAALKARAAVEGCCRVIAIEYLCAAQALHLLGERGMAPLLSAQLRRIRGRVAPLGNDRSLASDVERLAMRLLGPA